MNNFRKTIGIFLMGVFFVLCFALCSNTSGQELKEAAVSRDTLLAVAKDIMEKTRFCELITLDESGHPRVRPMDPFMPDEKMVIRMGTNRATRKAKQIRNDSRVTLYYAHPQHAGYVIIYGTAELIDDPKEKEKWWKQEWESHFSGKEENYILISVTPESMEVMDYTRGIIGDPDTWKPSTVEF